MAKRIGVKIVEGPQDLWRVESEDWPGCKLEGPARDDLMKEVFAAATDAFEDQHVVLNVEVPLFRK